MRAGSTSGDWRESEGAPQQAGLGGAAGAAILAQLPIPIHELTPKGQVPQRTQLREMGDDILRGGSPFARREGLES